MAEFDSSQEVHEINERIENSDQARRIIRRLSDYWDFTEGWKNNAGKSVSGMSEEEVRKLELKVFLDSQRFLMVD